MDVVLHFLERSRLLFADFACCYIVFFDGKEIVLVHALFGRLHGLGCDLTKP